MDGRVAARFEDVQAFLEHEWSEQWYIAKAQELEDEADGQKDE